MTEVWEESTLRQRKKQLPLVWVQDKTEPTQGTSQTMRKDERTCRRTCKRTQPMPVCAVETAAGPASERISVRDRKFSFGGTSSPSALLSLRGFSWFHGFYVPAPSKETFPFLHLPQTLYTLMKISLRSWYLGTMVHLRPPGWTPWTIHEAFGDK